MSSAIRFNLYQSQILLSGNGLTPYCMTKNEGLPKVKGLVNPNLNAVQMIYFINKRVENVLRKGEKSKLLAFALFPSLFLIASFIGSLMYRIWWKQVV